MPVLHAQRGPGQHAHHAVEGHQAHLVDDIEQAAPHRAGVHAQRAADIAGDTLEKLEPR